MQFRCSWGRRLRKYTSYQRRAGNVFRFVWHSIGFDFGRWELNQISAGLVRHYFILLSHVLNHATRCMNCNLRNAKKHELAVMRLRLNTDTNKAEKNSRSQQIPKVKLSI